jgi:hypothetical protein
MVDASANGRNGQYRNDQDSGPVGIAGDGDHARRFFGANGYGFANGIAAPRFQATIEAWVNPDDARDQSIAGHDDAGELLIRSGRFAFRHMDQTVTASVGPTPGTWSQVVGVWDGVELQIYVDGALRGSIEATKRPSSASTFYVGYGELAPWFKGAIDEVAYYDVALTPARVYQHWIADPPPDAAPAGDPQPPAAGGSGGGGGFGGGGGGGGTASKAPAATPPAATTDTPGTPAATPIPTASSPAAPASASPSRPVDKRLAACAKAKGAKKASCVKRARALIRCDPLKGARKKACVRKARRVGRKPH